MNQSEGIFRNLPNYLILEDKVYKLSITKAQDSDRAFTRGLIDLKVVGSNPISGQDSWRTLLGMSEDLFADYQGFRIPIPLEWLLFRFLCHHVRTNSVDLLRGPGGEVLKTTTFQDFIGKPFNDEQADQILKAVLSSWLRTMPGEVVELRDLFISTDLRIDTLRRSINPLKFQGHIEEFREDTYKIRSTILKEPQVMKPQISLDRKSNRYYQEIAIQAKEPFSFVIMPFRKEEFSQAIYFDVIKPIVEDEFKISCYRVDEDLLPDRIDNKIYTYILRSAFVIAEVTTRNPNVMYELGLAHMLEKDCIILTQRPHTEVPFDINRISEEPYENEDKLRSFLRKSILALAFKVNR